MCYKIGSYGVRMTREDAADLTLLFLLIGLFCFGAWNTHRRSVELNSTPPAVVSTAIDG